MGNGDWLGGMLNEFLHVHGFTLAVAVLGFLLLRWARKNAREGWKALAYIVILGGLAPTFLSIGYIVILGGVGVCSTGNCTAPPDHEGKCKVFIRNTYQCDPLISRGQAKKRMAMSDETQGWVVKVECLTSGETIPIPEDPETERDEFTKNAKYMWPHCQYDFTCIAREKRTGEWEISVAKIELGWKSRMEVDKTVCRPR